MVEHRKEDADVAAIEAEECIVSALFGDGSASAYTLLAQQLEPVHFYVPAFRMVYEVFGDMVARGETPDRVTLATHLKTKPGFNDRVRELVEQALTVTAALDNLASYADAVIEKWRARKIADSLSAVQRELPRIGGEQSSEDVLRKLDAIRESLTTREPTVGLLKSPLAVMTQVVERMEAVEAGEFTGVRTGILDLDEKLGGLLPGQLIIVGGRPSMGKTALAFNIATHHSISAVPALATDALQRNPQPPIDASPLGAIFSMEMDDTSLGMRVLSNLSSVEHGRIRKGLLEEADWSSLTVGMLRYSASNIRISQESYLTPSIVRARLRALIQQTGQKLAYIIVDYLQLMNSDKQSAGQNRTNEISDISRSLKQLAVEFECPVIALSQLSRKLEERSDKRPMMSDLRESGAIEQDADVILFIYRDEVYNPDSQAKGIAEIIIGKGRDAGIGMVPARCQLEFQRFSSIQRGDYSYESAYGG